MARITVPGFSGVVRITAPQRLEDHQAQVAIDCDFRSGDLRPYYGDKQSETFGGTYAPAPVANSLFLYDQSKLIVEGKDLSFARSPVFFSDNQDNDKRVFYTNNAVDNEYPMVLELLSSSGAMPAGNKRLGIPQPAEMVFSDAFGADLIDYEMQSGELLGYQIDTGDDGFVTIAKTAVDDAGMQKGDKFVLEAPGYKLGQIVRAKSLVPVGGASATDVRVFLENDKRPWRNVSLKFVKNETTIRLSASGHGFVDDDMVFFSHIRNTAGSRKFPTTSLGGDNVSLARPFRVINATYNDFEIQYHISGSGWTTLTRSAPWTGEDGYLWKPDGGDEVLQKKVALMASAESAFPNDMLPTVNTGSTEVFQMVASGTYNQDLALALWNNADTVDTVMDRSYCVTFVNQFGDESEPSLPTKTLPVVPGSPVTFKAGSIQIYASGASIGANRVTYYKTPTEVRLYRTDATGTFRLATTNADGSGTDTIDYATLETADPVYVDTKLDSDLGEPLATAGWSVPSIGLKGIINAPNGIVAAYKGRTIAGAVPYAPYAWPIANQVATDYEVVGLVPTSAGIVVVTKGMPAILIGDNPANWSMQKLEYPQGCVARRSIVDMGEFAMYASPDGLVAITGANVEILTKSIMTREQWQAYNPSSIIAAQVEGRYIATYLSGSTRKGFIYDPQTQSFTDLTLSAKAFTNDLLNDVLLMLDADGSIKEWNQNTSAFKPFYWQSKWFQLTIPELMGTAQILTTTTATTGRTLKMTLYGYDNNVITPIYTIETPTSPPGADHILGNRPFRLPYVAPGRFTAYSVVLEGTLPTGAVVVARTMDELKEA